MHLKITDLGSINSADIDIDRINVVGGVNSSGKSTVSKLLYCHLKSRLECESLDYLLGEEDMSCFMGANMQLECDIDFSGIFYIDNIPIYDIKDLNFLKIGHIRHIKDALESDAASRNPQFISEISKIMAADCSDASSDGIKQIGVILALLENNSLQKNSFLIIDEPESSLHPTWQIKFAQILTFLSKELNIYLYLNSHSPMFIEAMSLYAQYYDLLDATNFYLTEKTDNNRYVFKRIHAKSMGEVYENLTKPYDELDALKARILFRE